jgi:hypothetical protein
MALAMETPHIACNIEDRLIRLGFHSIAGERTWYRFLVYVGRET